MFEVAIVPFHEPLRRPLQLLSGRHAFRLGSSKLPAAFRCRRFEILPSSNPQQHALACREPRPRPKRGSPPLEFQMVCPVPAVAQGMRSAEPAKMRPKSAFSHLHGAGLSLARSSGWQRKNHSRHHTPRHPRHRLRNDFIRADKGLRFAIFSASLRRRPLLLPACSCSARRRRIPSLAPSRTKACTRPDNPACRPAD